MRCRRGRQRAESRLCDPDIADFLRGKSRRGNFFLAVPLWGKSNKFAVSTLLFATCACRLDGLKRDGIEYCQLIRFWGIGGSTSGKCRGRAEPSRNTEVPKNRMSHIFAKKKKREGIFVSTFRPWQTPIEQPGARRGSPAVRVSGVSMTIFGFDGFFVMFAVASFPVMQTAAGRRRPSEGQRKEVLRQKRSGAGVRGDGTGKTLWGRVRARSVSTRLTDV